ncbi:hypothetical protein Phum_PHUM091080 [Pediculus humanus corporis]|uniref:Transmembrane protein n=1 Tax=Pediculus humanus subsp. corporis TaxID=121224 RepID=E0VCN2_PEDHC|nr:uncharacterized protein Phum_PHUM091080 [Pediculus humanus corporis]EEB11138.1 hypothetical protein Phum_PHUM091080 [Pediculus humanus corporis]
MRAGVLANNNNNNWEYAGVLRRIKKNSHPEGEIQEFCQDVESFDHRENLAGSRFDIQRAVKLIGFIHSSNAPPPPPPLIFSSVHSTMGEERAVTRGLQVRRIHTHTHQLYHHPFNKRNRLEVKKKTLDNFGKKNMAAIKIKRPKIDVRSKRDKTNVVVALVVVVVGVVAACKGGEQRNYKNFRDNDTKNNLLRNN